MCDAQTMGKYEQISFISRCSMPISSRIRPNNINQAKLFLEVKSRDGLMLNNYRFKGSCLDLSCSNIHILLPMMCHAFSTALYL